MGGGGRSRVDMISFSHDTPLRSQVLLDLSFPMLCSKKKKKKNPLPQSVLGVLCANGLYPLHLGRVPVALELGQGPCLIPRGLAPQH